jgi:alpha-tubulin suppressor-like RCC1 family protein
VQGAGALAGDYKVFCSAGTAGSVTCWGAAPLVNAAGYDALGVALGISHACVLFQPTGGQAPTGNVVCFGLDTAGQLGNGTAMGTAPVVAPPGGGTLVEIAAGADSTFAVDAAGNLFSWGANWAGALGVGYSDNTYLPEDCPGEGACSTTPVAVTSLPAVAHVAAHWTQACASTVDGHVYCWGTPSHTSPASSNACGSTNPVCVPTPTLVQGVANATAIAVGYGHACALTGPLEVTCWGLDTHGQLGRGPGPNWDPTPVAVTIGPEPM